MSSLPVYFEGIVVAREDPKFMGRIKVRAIGYDAIGPMAEQDAPTERLPWCHVATPINDEVNTARAPAAGTRVWGYLMDGEAGDKRIVMGQSNIGYNEAQIADDGTGRNLKDAGLPDVQTDAALIRAGVTPGNISAAAASMSRVLIGHGQVPDAAGVDAFIGPRASAGADTTGEFSTSFKNAERGAVLSADKASLYNALISTRNELKNLTPAAIVRSLAGVSPTFKVWGQ